VDNGVRQDLRDSVQSSEPVDAPTPELKGDAQQAADQVKGGADGDTVTSKLGGDGTPKGEVSGGGESLSTLGKVSTAVAWITIGCIAWDIINTGVDKFIQLKSSGLVKIASKTFASADAQSLGGGSNGVPNLDLKQVAATNKLFDNGKESFTQSAAYARATGAPAPADKSKDLPEADRPFQTGNGTVNTILNTVQGHGFLGQFIGQGCGVLLNKVTLAAITVGEIGFLAVSLTGEAGLTFGAGDVAEIAGKVALQVAAVEAAKKLIPIAVAHYAHITVTGNEGPVQMTNKVDAGTDIMANESARVNGGHQLTDSEAQQQKTKALSYLHQQDRSRGLAYFLFSPDNPRSATSQVLTHIPSTPQSAIAAIGNTFASLFNPTKVAHAAGQAMLLLASPQTAFADVPATDPYGIPQYGLTDQELNRWSIRDNAAYVEGNISADDKARYDKCFDTPIAQIYAHPTDYAYCNDSNDQNLAHYRIYRMDKKIVGNLLLVGNHQAAGVNPTTGNPTDIQPGQNPGDSQQLAQEILASNRITFTTSEVKNELELVAQGKEVHLTCNKIARDNQATTTVSPTLLSALLTASEQYQIGIGYLVNGCHDSNSYHYTGDAVDIDTVNGQAATGQKSLDWQFLQYMSGIVPNGSGFGQASCGVAAHVHPTNQVSIFDDSCDHLHIQVPRHDG